MHHFAVVSERTDGLDLKGAAFGSLVDNILVHWYIIP
jgi:hypothetical protein